MLVAVDCAGAMMGGALRFLRELEAWLLDSPQPRLRLHGRGRPLTPAHLVRRELSTLGTRADRVVALNNVTQLAPGAERWVLLGNALHFPLAGDDVPLSGRVARSVAAQARLVRLAARRADVVMVPSGMMARRVLAHDPGVADRLVVRPHPLRTRAPAVPEPGIIVCPVLFAPYKRMPERLCLLVDALAELGPVDGVLPRVLVTATPSELEAGGLVSSRVTAVGRLDPSALDDLLARAQAVYFPTVVESFGYPLAEARAAGQWVVAPDTSHSREVAGGALAGYARETVDAVGQAVARALLEPSPEPDPGPFAPDRYFNAWLQPAAGPP